MKVLMSFTNDMGVNKAHRELKDRLENMDVWGVKEFSGKGKEFGEDTVRNMRMHGRIHFGHIRMDCQRTRERIKVGKQDWTNQWTKINQHRNYSI